MFVIGTAGHVDHGKSLLVERLTGIDPDRLREEKARGMTIDLGFAWLTLPSGRSVSIVDVPGHERFIKNMLAGAGGVDLALFVVAADDGVMPQTREHLAILDLLGVARGVVALTKCDLVDEDWLGLVSADIEALLQGTTLAGAPVIPCSSVTGAGIDGLLAALDVALDALPAKRDLGRARLPIDRVFTISGFGTVVTGTLIDGTLAVGDDVEAVPGGQRGRIRGLQSHRDKVERALPGTRTAVNLSGIPRENLRRGMVIAAPGSLRPVTVLDARIRAVSDAPRALRHGARLSLHAFADEAEAQLRLLDCDSTAPGGEAWAQLRLAAPVALLRGDRFVLRTPDDTVAGGVVVDVAPKRHRRGDPAVLRTLAALLSGRPEDRVLEAIARRPFIDVDGIARELSIDVPAVDTAIRDLGPAITPLGEGNSRRFATASFERSLRERALAALAAFHASHHLRTGMPFEEFRTRLGVDPVQLAPLLEAWSPHVAVRGPVIAIASFTPTLTLAERSAADAFLAALRASPAAPPSPNGLDGALLAFLVDSGAIVDAGDGMVFDAASFNSMRDRIVAHIEQHGAITLAQARDLLGTSRRYVQSILEYLDRARITVRHGDQRQLR